MPEQSHTTTGGIELLTDPTTLRDAGIPFREHPPETHPDHFEAYDPIAGMAVVGVTDDDGRLLVLEHDAAPHPVLPYAAVAPGDDYVAAARDAVAEDAGLAVEIERPRLARRCAYRRTDDGDDLATGHDVVFEASARPGERPAADRESEWAVAWVDGVDVDPEYDDSDVVADLRLFVE